jgi:hypothetical protein
VRFLYPAFLAGAAVIAVPIVLHLLRRDIAPEVPFSAVRLLRRSPIARSRRRRLRDLLLLAARVMAVLLVAGAFARPYFAKASVAASLRIIAIDRSFSMSAPGTFARARALASAAIDEAAAGERLAVIAFDDRAEAVSEPGGAGAARAALDTLKPSDGGTRYAGVLAKAAEIAGGDATRVVIVSDLQADGWGGEVHAAVPANLTVDVRDAGAPTVNAAVTAVRVSADRVTAAIRNEGKLPWKGDVRVERDGRVVATASAVVAPSSSADVAINYRSPSSGSIAVAIDDPGGFNGDNCRFVTLDPTPRSSVLVVTSGAADSGYYASRALAAALQESEVRMLSAAALKADELGRHSAVVLLSTRGMERRSRDAIAAFVRAGGGLFVAGSAEVEPVVLTTTFGWKPAFTAEEQAADTVAFSATDLRHPILRAFGPLTANLGQVRFNRTWRVSDAGWQLAARFSNGTAALVERREGAGRIVLFASDLDRRWNDFPVNPSYVPFVAESVRYVSVSRDTRRDYVVGSAPAGAQRQPGVYQTTDKRLVAVNADSRESSTAVMSVAQFMSMIDVVPPATAAGQDLRARQLEARQSYWQYGLVLMLAALVAESFVGRP